MTANRALQVLPGIGPGAGRHHRGRVGDVRRFSRPAKLCGWTGLTPRHRESDAKVTCGRITKQGSPLLRWAAVEAIQRQPATSPVRDGRARIAAARTGLKGRPSRAQPPLPPAASGVPKMPGNQEKRD